MVKCQTCNIRKATEKYPCENWYPNEYNPETACHNKVNLCKRCMNPNNVYACDLHKSDIQYIYCEYAGYNVNDSPVYYSFGDAGVRRVQQVNCKNCGTLFNACNIHKNSSPKKMSFIT